MGLERFVDAGTFSGGLGVNIHFADGHRRDIERIAAFGFRVVRTDLLWANIETERGKYDWRPSDELVRQLTDNHLTPLLILDYSNPLYAARVVGHPTTNSLAYAAPQIGAPRAAFMAFVRAAARRYGDRAIWEVWNEPDHNFGAPVDLRSYIGFAQEACQQLRETRPDATVIGPAASGFLWWFLRDFIAADRGRCYDAITVHPYRDEPPESVLGDWLRARSMLPRCLASSHCPALADSEWGYSVTGGAWTAIRQADYVVRLRLLDVMAGIPLSIIYDWQDDGSDPRDTEANFGLLDFRGGTKAAFTALAGMIQDLSGQRYMGHVVTSRRSDFLMAFGADGIVRKLVGWAASDGESEVAFSEPVCVDATYAGRATYEMAACGPSGFELRLLGRVKLSATPRTFGIENTPGSESLSVQDHSGALSQQVFKYQSVQ